jgi:mRNA interferase RelE/StbE
MAWKIDFSSNALKQLRKLDKPIASRILKSQRGRIEKLDDPRKIGERLQGPLGDFLEIPRWRLSSRLLPARR